jgi:hypothetical protein
MWITLCLWWIYQRETGGNEIFQKQKKHTPCQQNKHKKTTKREQISTKICSGTGIKIHTNKQGYYCYEYKT